MVWTYVWQTVLGGLVLAALGYIGAKWKKIWARLKAIWNGPSKTRAGVSLAQFEELKELLRPIQPDANGGKSLNDLHIKFDDFKDEVRRDFKEHANRLVEISNTASEIKGSLRTHMDTPNAHGERRK